jgi:hypothetical protein
MIPLTPADQAALAQAIIDALLKKTSAAGVAGKQPAKPEVIVGRGGNSNRAAPLGAGGQIPGAIQFNKEVQELAKALNSHGIGNKLKQFGETLKGVAEAGGITKSIVANQRMEMVEEAKAIMATQSGVFQRMSDSMIKYVEADGTNIKELSKLTNTISELRANWHKQTKDQFIEAGDVNFGALVDQLEWMETMDPTEFENLFTELPKSVFETIQKVRAQGFDASKLGPDEIEEVQSALNAVSDALEQGALDIAEVGKSMTGQIADLAADHSKRMTAIMRGTYLALGSGIWQMAEDSLFRFQASIGDTYHKAAIGMGMSHREVQEGMLDYRDTLRMEAAKLGTDIYSSASEDRMREIQNMGETFGLVSDEAFRFGMQMMESASLTGLSATLNSTDMRRFYAESAKTMGMTVQEFGDFFNGLSKDSSFVGFVNNIKAMGGNTQKVLQDEMGRRMKMNKLLGINNEQMQQRINMENSKKWAPLVDKYKSKLGTGELLKKYNEAAGGKALTAEQMEIGKTWAFDPSQLTKDEWKVFNEQVMPLLTVGPELVNRKYEDAAKKAADRGDKAEAERLRGLGNIEKSMLGVFGGLAPDSFDTKAADVAYAKLGQLGEVSGGIPIEEVLTAISAGTLQAGPMKDAVDAITGGNEKAMGMADKQLKSIEGIEGMLKTYMFGKETARGVGASGAAKMIGGLTGAFGSLFMEMTKYRMLHKALTGETITYTSMLKNLGGGIKETVTGAFSVFHNLGPKIGINDLAAAAGKHAAQMEAANGALGRFGVRLGTAGKMLGALGAIAAAAFIGWEIGKWIYEAIKDSPWFTDAADKTFDYFTLKKERALWNKMFGDESKKDWSKLDTNDAKQVDEYKRWRMQYEGGMDEDEIKKMSAEQAAAAYDRRFDSRDKGFVTDKLAESSQRAALLNQQINDVRLKTAETPQESKAAEVLKEHMAKLEEEFAVAKEEKDKLTEQLLRIADNTEKTASGVNKTNDLTAKGQEDAKTAEEKRIQAEKEKANKLAGVDQAIVNAQTNANAMLGLG